MPGILTVERADASDVTMRELQVHVDGQYWLDIRHGTTQSRPLDAGTHLVKVTNTLYTKRIEFHLADGEEARFSAGVLLPSFWTWMLVVLGAVPYRVFLKRLEP